MNQQQKSGPCSSTFCIDNYYCCACSKTSISNKYMQKAGEPENDAGFLKHNTIFSVIYANNGLTLNPTKCEVILISPSKPATTAPITTLEGEGLTPQLSAKCLGYWWCWDLSATKAVDKAIKKARRAFFQGQLNPISGRSIYETCVIPVLLFGCENWVLTDLILHQLESFQGEIGRRILKLTRHHSTLSTRMALRWPSVTARVLISKLSLLSKLSERGDSIGGQIFSGLPQESLKLVRECRYLEKKLPVKAVLTLCSAPSRLGER